MTDKIVSGKGVGSALGGAISDKLKARATGVKEKFDPMNVAKFMTGGSRLAPAIMGRLTGRSQSDINYFAGNRKNTYTQVPTSMANADGNLGGSAIEMLNKMFSFMAKMREEDVRKRETAKQFTEEQKVEEQRRHNDFLNVLRKYTSLNNTTLVEKNKEEEGGFNLFDYIKNLVGSFLEPFQWLKDLKYLKDIFNSKLFLSLFSNPLLLGMTAAAALLWLLKNDTNPETTTAGILGSVNDAAVGTEIMKQQEENVTPQELNKKFEVRRALLKDAPVATKYLGVDQREYLVKMGVPKEQVQQLFDDTKPLVVPEKLKSVDPQLYNTLVTEQKTATKVSKPGNISATVNANVSPVQSVTPTETKPTTTAPSTNISPVPQTPISSRMNDAVSENQNLSIQSTGNTQTPVAPVITNNTSSVDLPDRPIPATATVRDKTPILDHVLQLSLAPV